MYGLSVSATMGMLLPYTNNPLLISNLRVSSTGLGNIVNFTALSFYQLHPQTPTIFSLAEPTLATAGHIITSTSSPPYAEFVFFQRSERWRQCFKHLFPLGVSSEGV